MSPKRLKPVDTDSTTVYYNTLPNTFKQSIMFENEKTPINI